MSVRQKKLAQKRKRERLVFEGAHFPFKLVNDFAGVDIQNVLDAEFLVLGQAWIKRFKGGGGKSGIVPYAIDFCVVIELEILGVCVGLFKIVDVHANVVAVVSNHLFIGPDKIW